MVHLIIPTESLEDLPPFEANRSRKTECYKWRFIHPSHQKKTPLHPKKEKERDRSQPRINLLHNIMSRILTPIPTRLRHNLRHIPLLDPLGLLHQIDIQPPTHMPRDVAVKGPYARVVGVVLQHEVAVWLHHLHVAPVGEGVVCYAAVPGAGAFGEDEEVVPVEMHGVEGGEVVFDD